MKPSKSLTQRLPFLLPLRRWQKKQCFYWRMRHDGARYAAGTLDGLLPCLVCEASSEMVNPGTGQDIQYQYNKVHNLALAGRTMDRLVLLPGQTFSFWQRVRGADKATPYKDGLVLVDGKLTAAYGGGLCQLSNLLFWLFLHTPLTVVERHGHRVEYFPAEAGFPCGVDATVHEGWLDLKVKNETDQLFQICVGQADGRLWGRIYSDTAPAVDYQVSNGAVRYCRRDGAVWETAEVLRQETERATGRTRQRLLYENVCRIGYPLPAGTVIEDETEGS